MAKEIKELQSRKEELDQQANQLTDALTIAAQEYEQCQQRLQVCQEALKEAVLKSDVERAELLTRRANQLHRCLSTVHSLQAQLQKLATPEDPGHDASSSSGMQNAVSFVEHELNVILAEHDELQQKHPTFLTSYIYIEDTKDLILEEDSDKDDDDVDEGNDLDGHATIEPVSDSNTIDTFISKDPECVEREGNSLILVGDSSEGEVPATGDGSTAAAETAAVEEEDAAAEPTVVDNNTDSEERNIKIQQAKVFKYMRIVHCYQLDLFDSP